MKIAVISDIHGNAPALRAVWERISGRVDTVLFLGDLAGYYSFVEDCVPFLDSGNVIGVRGNHDEVLVRCIRTGRPPENSYRERYGSALERAWRELSERGKRLFLSWPEHTRIQLGSRTISMYHGAPWDPLEARVYPDFGEWDRFAADSSDIMLLGHTHYAFSKVWNGKLIVNPGSVGQPRDHKGAGACYAEMNLETLEVTHHRISYDNRTVLDDSLRHDPHLPYLTEVFTR